MGISRDHRRDRRDTRVVETGVALDVVAGTWADPTGSYYEAAMVQCWAVSMDWFMGKSMGKSTKNMDPTIKMRSFL